MRKTFPFEQTGRVVTLNLPPRPVGPVAVTRFKCRIVARVGEPAAKLFVIGGPQLTAVPNAGTRAATICGRGLNTSSES